MKTYQGKTASPGLAIGPVYRIHHAGPGLGRSVDLPVREQALFEAALVLAKDELRQLEEKADPQDQSIFTFQASILDDPALLRETQNYIAAGAGAAAAMERASQICARRIEAVDDEYIRQRGADVRDACRRVVNILDGKPRTPIQLIEPSILMGETLFPSDIVSVGRGMILGLAASDDSEQSHSAIIARTMGIPALVQLGKDCLDTNPGSICLLDAENGQLMVQPDGAALLAAQRRMASAALLQRRLSVLKDELCMTLDGVTVRLMANCSTPEDIEVAMSTGADGVGLLRSEFMINGGRVPGEEEQFYFYTACLQAAGGKPVTVRTFDIGADKAIEGLSQPEANPALGVRGLRFCLGQRQLFLNQLCALLRAADKGPLRVMFPMVSCQEDWRCALECVEQAKELLHRRGVAFNERTPMGIMVEVPSAALLAHEFVASGCDFFSIGTNDLTQYTYAADRMDNRFAGYFSGSARAVHRLMDMVLDAAAQADLPVCVCGVAASEPERAVQYVRQGVRELSLESSRLLCIKARLREEDLTAPHL